MIVSKFLNLPFFFSPLTLCSGDTACVLGVHLHHPQGLLSKTGTAVGCELRPAGSVGTFTGKRKVKIIMKKNKSGKVWEHGAQHRGEEPRGSPATLATAEVRG